MTRHGDPHCGHTGKAGDPRTAYFREHLTRVEPCVVDRVCRRKIAVGQNCALGKARSAARILKQRDIIEIDLRSGLRSHSALAQLFQVYEVLLVWRDVGTCQVVGPEPAVIGNDYPVHQFRALEGERVGEH